jgi:hypothetical protein
MAPTTTTAMTITADPSIRPTWLISCCGGGLFHRLVEQSGHIAHLGAHRGGGHHGAAPPRDGRASESLLVVEVVGPVGAFPPKRFVVDGFAIDEVEKLGNR